MSDCEPCEDTPGLRDTDIWPDPKENPMSKMSTIHWLQAIYTLLDARLPEPDEDDGEFDWRAMAAYACEKALGASDEDAFRTAQAEREALASSDRAVRLIERAPREDEHQCPVDENGWKCVLYRGHDGDHAAEGSVPYDNVRAEAEKAEAERDFQTERADGLGLKLQRAEAERDDQKARAEKAEAERDEFNGFWKEALADVRKAREERDVALANQEAADEALGEELAKTNQWQAKHEALRADVERHRGQCAENADDTTASYGYRGRCAHTEDTLKVILRSDANRDLIDHTGYAPWKNVTSELLDEVDRLRSALNAIRNGCDTLLNPTEGDDHE